MKDIPTSEIKGFANKTVDKNTNESFERQHPFYSLPPTKYLLQKIGVFLTVREICRFYNRNFEKILPVHQI